MEQIYAYVKNIEKNGKLFQVLNVVYKDNNKTITKSYFLNYSTKKNTCYLSEKDGK